MTAFVALLRAVNVGGTGKLPMAELAALCSAAGFAQVTTYIASGNVVFACDLGEAQVRAVLEERLLAHTGRGVGVVVRSAAEVADVLARNPWPDEAGARVMALCVDGPLPAHPLDGATGLKDEEVRLGRRELFVRYPTGMAATRLRLLAEKAGTARNMNTVAKLAEMAAALA